ncbi:peritrophin-1-like [Gigantopelta aegis]|uniref:peritrophin-1-like n=1 Tax=Gigantopelta aegis TaxID=1735272 RepID=UPI001B889D23|nr:peritrophin-1-like [Gigantopelta aegis]
MTQKRLRKCDNPKRAHGGRDCDGESTQTRHAPCTTGMCAEMCSAGSEPYVAHPDPTMFYQCDHGVAYIHHCPAGTRWDQSKFTCVHLKQAASRSTEESSKGCPQTGVVAVSYNDDCNMYVQCTNGHSDVMACPKGTRFDAKIGGCNHASLVECN